MTVLLSSCAVHVSDESGVGEARRAARRAARELGLEAVAIEQAAIVAAEAARNAVVHGRGGQVVISPAPGGTALDVVALDRGPGIPDLRRALEDGYSTGGTAGQGLGAIARIATVFDLYSAPARGTALLARIGTAARGRTDVGAISVPLASEKVCGDAWAVERPDGRPVVLVADGLGHGPRAAEAAEAAVAAFREHAALPAERLLDALHAALRPTRGAAVAVAAAIAGGDRVRYGGIGNVSGVLLDVPHVRRLVSMPGTAGHQARTIRTFEYEWRREGLLIMHSDGVAGHWDLGEYPGLPQRHPALVAAVLYRDFARPRDDATVVVLRREAP